MYSLAQYRVQVKRERCFTTLRLLQLFDETIILTSSVETLR